MKLLKKKCEDSNIVVSQTAFQGMVTLVECGVLQMVPTLCDFMASIPFITHFNGLLISITSLIVMELKMDRKAFDGSLLRTTQHPFVMLLKHNANISFDVLNQIEFVCNHINTK